MRPCHYSHLLVSSCLALLLVGCALDLEAPALDSVEGAVLPATLTYPPTAYQSCGLEPDPRTYTDDTSPSLAYAGTWKAETPGLGLYQGTQHITNSGGSTASHTFTTNGHYPSIVSYGYRKMRNAGKAAVYWDGQPFTTISLYAPDNVYHCELVFYDMPAGTHTLMVKVLNQQEPASGGTYVNVDFFGNYEF